MGVGGPLARAPRPAYRLDEGEHPVAHGLEHPLRRKLLETRPTQIVLVGGEHRLLDRFAGAGGLVPLARVQLVQALDEEQVGELHDDRERVRDAAGPHGVPDSVDLAGAGSGSTRGARHGLPHGVHVLGSHARRSTWTRVRRPISSPSMKTRCEAVATGNLGTRHSTRIREPAKCTDSRIEGAEVLPLPLGSQAGTGADPRPLP